MGTERAANAIAIAIVAGASLRAELSRIGVFRAESVGSQSSRIAARAAGLLMRSSGCSDSIDIGTNGDRTRLCLGRAKLGVTDCAGRRRAATRAQIALKQWRSQSAAASEGAQRPRPREIPRAELGAQTSPALRSPDGGKRPASGRRKTRHERRAGKTRARAT